MTGNKKGHKQTEKSKEKISKTMTGNQNAICKPIIINNIQYCSTVLASRVLGINTTTICYRLNSISNKFKNYNYSD